MAARRRNRKGTGGLGGFMPPGWAVATLLVVAVVAIVVALVFSQFGEQDPESAAAAKAVSERYEIPTEGAAHVDQDSPITYDHYPPSSGPHYGRPAVYRVSDTPVPEGSWVHNLEHGAIVLLFKCGDGCETRVKQIQDLFDRLPDGNFGEVKMVATPYDRAPTEFTLLAWGWQEDLDEFDAGRIERFYRDLVDKGPEAAP